MNHKQVQIVFLDRMLGDVGKYAEGYKDQPGFTPAKLASASGHLVAFLTKRIEKLKKQVAKANA